MTMMITHSKQCFTLPSHLPFPNATGTNELKQINYSQMATQLVYTDRKEEKRHSPNHAIFPPSLQARTPPNIPYNNEVVGQCLLDSRQRPSSG